jgi:Spy/CpxP family protein refolding chaperone
MKKFFMMLMAAGMMLFAGMSTANAQGPGGGFNFDPDEMVKMRVDQMKQTLKINKDQEAKLTALFKKQNEEMAKMFEGGGMPDMSKMQENMKKQDDEIKKILTADQYKAYSEEQKKMREQFGGGGF